MKLSKDTKEAISTTIGWYVATGADVKTVASMCEKYIISLLELEDKSKWYEDQDGNK